MKSTVPTRFGVGAVVEMQHHICYYKMILKMPSLIGFAALPYWNSSMMTNTLLAVDTR